MERTGGKPFDFNFGRLPFASGRRLSPAAPLRPTAVDEAASLREFGELVDALSRDGSISCRDPVVPIDNKSADRGGHPA